MADRPVAGELGWVQSHRRAGFGASAFLGPKYAGASSPLKECSLRLNHRSTIWFADCCVHGRKEGEGD